jgi:hypothetical protein
MSVRGLCIGVGIGVGLVEVEVVAVLEPHPTVRRVTVISATEPILAAIMAPHYSPTSPDGRSCPGSPPCGIHHSGTNGRIPAKSVGAVRAELVETQANRTG